MAIKLKTKRSRVFNYKDGDVDLTFKFEFPVSEDLDYGKIRKMMDENTPVEYTDEKTGKVKTSQGELNAYLFVLRSSLKEWTGLVDEDENELEFNEMNQKAVFEYIKSQEDLYERVMQSYGELNAKN